ncbi:MAG: butyrate kinase [Bacteroidales bacterium]|nr:butyrate kinase [Bacteroidales bacterium]
MSKKILVIYPEGVSTQIAVYLNTNLIFLKSIKHKPEELSQFKDVNDQLEYRTNLVINELKENEINFNLIGIIVARGGLVKPLKKAGVYEVNEQMKDDLKIGIMGKHVSNLGGLIAYNIAKMLNVKAYLADPVVIDELDDVARVTGHPLFERKSVFHTLNQKFFVRKYAKAQNKKYEELNLIVVTIGKGGISVGAHKNGRVIDVNNAFDGDGPFSIRRTGTLPMGDLVKLCFSGKYKEEEVIKMLTKEGGYTAYLGTRSIDEIDNRMASGDEKALFYSYAMAYQVSKEIGAMFTVLEGNVDAIILTGNIFNSDRFLANIKARVGKIAEISLYPSLNDIEALAQNGLMVLTGELEVLEYK